jgi:hypothetical protein
MAANCATGKSAIGKRGPARRHTGGPERDRICSAGAESQLPDKPPHQVKEAGADYDSEHHSKHRADHSALSNTKIATSRAMRWAIVCKRT